MLASSVALGKRKEIDSIKSLKSQKVDVDQNEREMPARGPETVFYQSCLGTLELELNKQIHSGMFRPTVLVRQDLTQFWTRQVIFIDSPNPHVPMLPKVWEKFAVFSIVMNVIELIETFPFIHSLLSPRSSLWSREIKD